MATVHHGSPAIYERGQRLGFGYIVKRLVSGVCPGGPYIIDTVSGQSQAGGIIIICGGPSRHDSTILDVATIILNQ